MLQTALIFEEVPQCVADVPVGFHFLPLDGNASELAVLDEQAFYLPRAGCCMAVARASSSRVEARFEQSDQSFWLCPVVHLGLSATTQLLSLRLGPVTFLRSA